METRLIICIAFCVGLLFSCQTETKNNTITEPYYIISYGGFLGGRCTTKEYKIKDGYYLFVRRGDSIKIKEELVETVRKVNNTN
tara:strand:+ start:2915 stop:3166 length:252 start_codon:yes stop_codon:yes gene_type:complete